MPLFVDVPWVPKPYRKELHFGVRLLLSSSSKGLHSGKSSSLTVLVGLLLEKVRIPSRPVELPYCSVVRARGLGRVQQPSVLCYVAQENKPESRKIPLGAVHPRTI